ncbi:hypothetical protein [Paramagnetospirillum magneticum]|uniref:Glycosyltransferase RgtA/B/C/D-like domain-containing protein n=1 Tax=Paramagnetospirillum magneticum (strain ATCC 700264 / AMB-1) TaxID=342108 RepID=Q2W7Y4_PARM1|nr:hypothetical protein [Paramagnetospirillum magneticum]BAE50041.1 hypothetical protein amb1237 [Paramagnetospirillum magneticum AMB-1]
MARVPLTGRKLAYHALTFVLVVLLLMAPALWNGYPLVYFDSEDYVEMAFSFQPIIWRIMTYGMFCSIARFFGTLWALPLVHAILTTWVLHEAVMGFIGRWRHMVFLGVGLALALFTGLPWVSSQLLADVFAGVAILGIAALAFGEGLQPWRRFALVVITAIAICVHMSHVAVAAGLLLVLVTVWLGSRFMLRMPRPRLTAPVMAIVAGILLVPVTHYFIMGRFVFSESGQVLQLALLVQNGMAKKYLDEVCPKGADLEMCDHKDELPHTADEFLWGDSPFDEMGGWKALHDEAGQIVSGAIRLFPADMLNSALANTWEQLNSIESGEDLVPMTWHFVRTQLRRYPDEFRQFRFARQQRRPAIDFFTINSFQIPINWGAELLTPILLVVAWRRRDRTTTGLAIIVVAAIIGNAIVCGALSNPHDRYQNRVVWLALFTAMVGAVRLDQRFAGQRRLSIRAENEALAAEAAEGKTPPA